MVQTVEDYRKYLDPQVLAHIGGLELRARLLVEGFISGMHRSPAHGFSVEFAEHRKYSQGDDLRFLDWKVFGRTDKHYIKQYEQESNLQLVFAVDSSESMSYRSPQSPWSKREYAMTVVAAMAYIALHQADSVALTTFDTRLRRAGRASNQPGRWKSMVHELAATEARGQTSFRAVLDELAESMRDRHLVVLVSDFFGPAEEIIAGMKHLRHRRHEPVVMQLMDHAELTFPFESPLQLVGLESIPPVSVEPRVLRAHYLREMRAFTEQLRRACHEQQCDYVLLDTCEPLSGALSAFLNARSSKARG
ncbi:MAG: DUF58 domain-containing protein [Planctomycetota bacterium]|nr:MAG: DUF58 domain-containing protein [Planctomycetota bacterium]